MRETPENILAGIGALEAAASHLHKIHAIRAWEGLSPGQRMTALAIACLEYADRVPPGSLAVSRMVGLDPEKVEKIFQSLEHPPYYWSEIAETRHWAFLPAQKLEYGAA